MSYYDHATMMALKLGPWRDPAAATRNGHNPHRSGATADRTVSPASSNHFGRLVRQLLGGLSLMASAATRAAPGGTRERGGDAPGKT
ncbi:hypothetical protein OEG84_14980 [Hoeflea sp. G2-23]|uniref:Uncharacterized protein n=1 Tax=Hoeflea algicola TaxID=2983763 RepID=A0ABT3ZB75_9HYPH|nr:hypothetical protein [Hoeflea algicola]MCY0148973.1 hypothetical protein [Hoeflea algicola]